MFCGAEIPAYDSVAYDQVKTSLSKALAEVQELASQLSLGARRSFRLNARDTRGDWLNVNANLRASRAFSNLAQNPEGTVVVSLE